MYTHHFANFSDHIWLNAASEGPLPLGAKEALDDIVAKKSRPYELTFELFAAVPVQLKKQIGQLINVPYRDVILGNSASYGLHILANGIVWEAGDEVIVMQNDFPTDILPWLALEKQGVIVKQVKAEHFILTPDELKEAMTPRTRVVCLSHVHTFSGWMLDVLACQKICHEAGVKLVINISQSAGTRPVDVSAWGVDAIVCAGYKWLCGPYGVGFCWVDPDWRAALTLNQAYWTRQLSEEELMSEGPITLRDVDSARKYDVFGTANFFNFVPFSAALELWQTIGMECVLSYNDQLQQYFIDRLDKDKYQCISPTQADQRSSLIVISHRDSARNGDIHQKLTEKNLHTALWKNKIRIAPHVYNVQNDIDQLLDVLHSLG